MKPIIALLLCYVTITNGLLCMECDESESIAECDVNGRLVACQSNQKTCETVVRRSGYSPGDVKVIKGCKQKKACRNNQAQNTQVSGGGKQCNADQPSSVCSCCCVGDGCNIGEPPCIEEVINVTCPVQATFYHGDMICSNDNREGSVCKFMCTEDVFSVYPDGVDANQCMGSGVWNITMPCCARPCPPYFLYDMVTIYHTTNVQLFDIFSVGAIIKTSTIAIGPEATQSASFYYSDKVNEESVVHFNDYNYNRSLGIRLYDERTRPNNSANGKVNTGAAIRWALRHMFNESRGARRNVPKVIVVAIDSNSDDDVTAASQAARDAGILLYVFNIPPAGGALDQDQMLSITNDVDHIFTFDPERRNFFSTVGSFTTDVISHFCSDPCNHAFHN
ncbi:matrilin-3-like [Ciona intestinalis]